MDDSVIDAAKVRAAKCGMLLRTWVARAIADTADSEDRLDREVESSKEQQPQALRQYTGNTHEPSGVHHVPLEDV